MVVAKQKNIPKPFCHWPLTQGKGWAMNFHLLILSLWISVPFSSEHCLKKRNYNLIRKRCTMHSTIYYPQHFWYVLGNCICKITKFWGRHGQTNAAHTVYSLYLYMNIIPILFLFTSEFSDGQLPLHLWVMDTRGIGTQSAQLRSKARSCITSLGKKCI